MIKDISMSEELVHSYIKETAKYLRLPGNVQILDTTLRDGEQTPGVYFSPEEKMRIAQRLDDIGVDIIEAGFPIVSSDELTAIKMITDAGLHAKIAGVARALEEDIDAAIKCKVDYVHLFIATSNLHMKYKLKMTSDEVIKRAIASTKYALENKLKVEFSAEDATRSSPEYLKEFYSEVQNAGASIISVNDTVGVMTPRAMYQLISEIKTIAKVPVSVHCHNDFGMSVANSLAGIEAGAEQVQVTVNGLGDRAGNARLDEVSASLLILYGIKTIREFRQLVPLSELVAEYSRMPVPPNKPIVGANAFAHESGIHVHGVLEHMATYEPLTPELVGHKREIIIGKHTGSHGIRFILNKMGMYPEESQLKEILEIIKKLGNTKEKITDIKLKEVAESVITKSI